mmetsp:Transcript_30070/g.34954  ORF Transcript_30070/g.34954 Transcript_30070/m.34954 type:complete len:644 (-) Transcript_30070:180-2111(-)
MKDDRNKIKPEKSQSTSNLRKFYTLSIFTLFFQFQSLSLFYICICAIQPKVIKSFLHLDLPIGNQRRSSGSYHPRMYHYQQPTTFRKNKKLNSRIKNRSKNAMTTLLSSSSSSTPSNIEMNTNTNTNTVSILNRYKKAPIFITIGPQNAGKTTWMSKLENANYNHTDATQDITLDDQYGVYIQTPINLWFHNDKKTQPTTKTKTQTQSLLQTIVHNKTISDRIYDSSNDEMRIVIQRLHGVITKEEFEQNVLELSQVDLKVTTMKMKQMTKNKTSHCENDSIDNLISLDWGQCLIHVVEEFHELHISSKMEEKKEHEQCDNSFSSSSSSTCAPTQIAELFVVESIFKTPSAQLSAFLSRENKNKDVKDKKMDAYLKMSGLDAVKAKLKHLSKNSFNTSIVWCNTNTKAKDYVQALEAAEESQRPVVFVPYIDPTNIKIDDCDDDFFLLESVGLMELLRRNINRVYTNGKYVPVKAIMDASLRVNELIKRSFDHLETEYNTNSTPIKKIQFDSALAKLAGFQMNSDRTVRRMGKGNMHKKESTRGNRFPGGRGKESNYLSSGRGRGSYRPNAGKDGVAERRLNGRGSNHLNLRQDGTQGVRRESGSNPRHEGQYKSQGEAGRGQGRGSYRPSRGQGRGRGRGRE